MFSSMLILLFLSVPTLFGFVLLNYLFPWEHNPKKDKAS